MSNISMDLVKELREKTQVGMMDCKKALAESNGDIEKAIEFLRKRGSAVAAKRAGNEMNNGRIECFVSADNKSGAIVAVGCETDFSANTENMKQFVDAAAHEAVTKNITDAQALMAGSSKISDMLNELIAKISEKIEITKVAMFAVEGNGLVNAYIHPGSTVGVLVELATNGAGDVEVLKQTARDVCMHIAVRSPLCVNPADLDPAILAKEKEIAEEQLKSSGKPAAIIEKIMLGKVNKYHEDVCLAKQKYIKNEDLSIEQHLNEIGKKLGITVAVKRFARFGIGGK